MVYTRLLKIYSCLSISILVYTCLLKIDIVYVRLLKIYVCCICLRLFSKKLVAIFLTALVNWGKGA